MPTPEECRQMQIDAAESRTRLNSQSERLDEMIIEIKRINDTLTIFASQFIDMIKKAFKYGWYSLCVLTFIAIFGKDALPILLKFFGVTQ